MVQEVRKAYREDTHRAISTEQTFARVKPFLKRMGITRIANVTGLDRISIPVIMVSRPNSRSVSVSQGKGLSLMAAKVSGVMEAIETWHAERVSLPLRHASYNDLVDEVLVVDVERLPAVVDTPFTKTKRILWIEGRNLLTEEPQWLPYEMIHTDYTVPRPSGSGCFSCSTNGLASGNHLIEATCHAICEVIERDAISLWQMLSPNLRKKTRVDPSTVSDPLCQEVIRRFEAARIDFGIWDLTSDVGIATFRCMIVDKDEDNGHIGIGDGCHNHRGIALLRALTEAVQTRLTYISGSRDDLNPEEFTQAALKEKCDYVCRLISEGQGQRSFLDSPHFDSETFEEDQRHLLTKLSDVGCAQVVAVDLSKPNIGIAVVRVVIPGLEAPHDDDSYSPGARAQKFMEAFS